MEYYYAELVGEDITWMTMAVNQGIDSHLQAVTESKFGESNHRLICEIAPQDMGVILRRLLELADEHGKSEPEYLALDIAGTLGINEIWLMTGDRFYITLIEEDEYFKEGWDFTASLLDLPYVSIFNEQFWVTLFEELV